ncbi:hypothetical protein POVCU2_0023190 [Plasmodium ovale curtisi]|uniref:Uncharacterized protein n=1 Tax=Plasmodium ovale curtisi TaxID=864141 RepID=A0A1A8VTJ5_PLAOA|nr:hypothetical protein POVCU2_0023190 [Plasmodium ovale curtisi]
MTYGVEGSVAMNTHMLGRIRECIHVHTVRTFQQILICGSYKSPHNTSSYLPYFWPNSSTEWYKRADAVERVVG